MISLQHCDTRPRTHVPSHVTPCYYVVGPLMKSTVPYNISLIIKRIIQNLNRGAENAGVPRTLKTYIREVLGSNLGRRAGYSEIFRGFPLSFRANAGIVPKFGHDRIVPNPFQFIIYQSSYHSTLYSVVK
jgi:hypothetical protein